MPASILSWTCWAAWCVLTLADEYGVDLEQSFFETMDP